MTKLIILSHPSRAEAAQRLYRHMNLRMRARGIEVVVLTDDSGEPSMDGAAEMHLRALESVADDERVIVMEDDALPIFQFRTNLLVWLHTYPDALISFYLGDRSHGLDDPFMLEQWSDEGSVIFWTTLCHGLCYTVPRNAPHLAGMVRAIRQPGEPIDFAIGNAWIAMTTQWIVHLKASLVEHADWPSLVHVNPKPPRRAWKLAAPISPAFAQYLEERP